MWVDLGQKRRSLRGLERRGANLTFDGLMLDGVPLRWITRVVMVTMVTLILVDEKVSGSCFRQGSAHDCVQVCRW